MINSVVTHQPSTLIGVDLGGTKLQVARIRGRELLSQSRDHYNALGSAAEVLDTLIAAISKQLTREVKALGLGVPSVLNPQEGIVYEAANIPAWKEIHLKQELQARFDLPVFINNDVNCFALGEFHFGHWPEVRDMACISLGTGMGVGLILNGQLYSGHSCGAGELGELPYGDSKLENYCSGQYFVRELQQEGGQVFTQAQTGNPQALAAYAAFGQHLSQALSTVLLAYNPQVVVLGGSVSRAYEYFAPALQNAMASFPFQSLWRTTRLVPSQTVQAPVLGAAALCYSLS